MFYNKNYKKLLVVPVIIFILLPFIALNVPKGIEFTGGVQITLITKEKVNTNEIKDIINSAGIEKANLIFTKGSDYFSTIIEFQDTRKSKDLIKKLKEKYPNGEIAMREITPTLGDYFWKNAIFVASIAVILIILVIFLFFREIIPSIAIILAALMDVLFALSAMSLFKIPLSLATIPALLMLIGYSVDTDIMLTTRILKRKGDIFEKANEALKTGLTMTTTTLAALFVMLVISYFFKVDVLFTISFVLFSGLIGDLFSTWLMNAPILLWYSEKKGKK